MVDIMRRYVARAYINQGRWVADCPRPHCTNAQLLAPGQMTFDCGILETGLRSPSGCNLICEIDWPPNAAELLAELERRPVPGTRNWFPADHELAMRANCPHGQSVADLDTEFAAMDPAAHSDAHILRRWEPDEPRARLIGGTHMLVPIEMWDEAEKLAKLDAERAESEKS